MFTSPTSHRSATTNPTASHGDVAWPAPSTVGVIDTTAHTTELRRIDAMPAPIEPTTPTPSVRSRAGASITRAARTAAVAPARLAHRAVVRPAAAESHLRTEITIARRRLGVITDPSSPAWSHAAGSLLDDAEIALADRRAVEGWQLLRAAQAEMLAGLDARGLAIEHAALHDTDAVVPTDAEVPLLRAELWSVRQRLDRRRAEVDRRLHEASRSIVHRAVGLLTVLVLGAIGVLLAAPSSDPSDALGSISAYVTIVGLGMTGAAVSRVVARSSDRRGSAVTAMTSPAHVLALRFAFGGVVGLLLVMFLQADLQNLINVAGQNAYPWAILGGFAERYVDRAIEAADDDALRADDGGGWR